MVVSGAASRLDLGGMGTVTCGACAWQLPFLGSLFHMEKALSLLAIQGSPLGSLTWGSCFSFVSVHFHGALVRQMLDHLI